MGGESRGASGCVIRLTLTRFRNYTLQRVVTDGRPVVLTGSNGAGKTNLLEAISLLSPGRGLRGARLGELGHRSALGGMVGGGPDTDEPDAANDGATAGWAVAATVLTPRGPVDLGTGEAGGSGSARGRDGAGEGATEGRERRLVRIDGRNARSVALGEHLTVTWLTPQMDRLFLEGAGERRRFLDRLVFGLDPAHAGRLARYERALRERAHLLRDGCRDEAWLAGLEDIMATSGVAVAAARLDMVRRLTEACASGGTGPFPRPRLRLVGTIDDDLAGRPALTVEDGLRRQLRADRAGDAKAGGAGVGPQRSDLKMYFPEFRGPDFRGPDFRGPDFRGPDSGAGAGEGRPAEQCSTGEQKALLISLVLANARLLMAERGRPPVLLLDEVVAHLDEGRRRALFDELLALGCQAWLSGTDAALFAPLAHHGHWLRVAGGQVSEGGD